MKKDPGNILVCRNDALGDAILALPTCGLIKKYYPDSKVFFLGRTYTQDAVLLSKYVDEFVNYDEVKQLPPAALKEFFAAKQIHTALLLRIEKELAKFIRATAIPVRVGNFHSTKHWWTCNRFVNFGHRNSGLNEAQLDAKMLRALHISELPDRKHLPDYYGIKNIPPLQAEWKSLLSPAKFNLVLHPMMTGHEREWGTANFGRLISLLDKGYYHLFITGSPEESRVLHEWIGSLPDSVTDLTGKLSLQQLIAFIAASDGLIGGSTGPTHVAAAIGIPTLGLYTNRPTQDAGRWGPIGYRAEVIQCNNELVRSIPVENVLAIVQKWEKLGRRDGEGKGA